MRLVLLVLAACATAAPPPPEPPPGHLVEDMQDLAKSLRTAPYETLLEVADGPVAYFDIDTLRNGVACPYRDVGQVQAWATLLEMPTRDEVSCHETRSRRATYHCMQIGRGPILGLSFVRLQGQWRLVSVTTVTMEKPLKLVKGAEEEVMNALIDTASCP